MFVFFPNWNFKTHPPTNSVWRKLFSRTHPPHPSFTAMHCATFRSRRTLCARQDPAFSGSSMIRFKSMASWGKHRFGPERLVGLDWSGWWAEHARCFGAILLLPSTSKPCSTATKGRYILGCIISADRRDRPYINENRYQLQFRDMRFKEGCRRTRQPGYSKIWWRFSKGRGW